MFMSPFGWSLLMINILKIIFFLLFNTFTAELHLGRGTMMIILPPSEHQQIAAALTMKQSQLF